MARLLTALFVFAPTRVHSFTVLPAASSRLYSASSALEMTKRVLVPIADGSEEIETTCITDTLTRCGAEVTVASVMPNQLTCKMSRGIKVREEKINHQSITDAERNYCRAYEKFFFSPNRSWQIPLLTRRQRRNGIWSSCLVECLVGTYIAVVGRRCHELLNIIFFLVHLLLR